MFNYLIPLLILNMTDEPVLPEHFRICEAVCELPISGSGQFSEKSWKTIEQTLNHPSTLYDLDLRQESHGFLNGAAISWYVTRDWINKGKTNEEALQGEKELLSSLAECAFAIVAKVLSKTEEGAIDTYLPLYFPLKKVQTEEQMIPSHYQRILLVDHLPLTDENIEALVTFYHSLPQDAWVHIHCAGGDGRTTSVMVLFDILKNGKTTSFDEIIARQYRIGGIDLSHFGPSTGWKYPYAKARYEKLKAFYENRKTS